MAWVRGTSLVSVPEIVQLTGSIDLANLEASGEFTRSSLLVTASDAIYDQADADGLDPATIANPEIYKRAVAWHFLALAAKQFQSLVPKGEDAPVDPFTWSDPYYRRVRPRATSGDDPAPGSKPVLGNFTRRGFFDTGFAGEFYGDFPSML